MKVETTVSSDTYLNRLTKGIKAPKSKSLSKKTKTNDIAKAPKTNDIAKVPKTKTAKIDKGKAKKCKISPSESCVATEFIERSIFEDTLPANGTDVIQEGGEIFDVIYDVKFKDKIVAVAQSKDLIPTVSTFES